MKLGDRVKVVKKIQHWDSDNWISDEMDQYLGQKGMITRELTEEAYFVTFENEEEWNFHKDCLELVISNE